MGCQTARLPDCQIAGLPHCHTATLPSIEKRERHSLLSRQGVWLLPIEEGETLSLSLSLDQRWKLETLYEAEEIKPKLCEYEPVGTKSIRAHLLNVLIKTVT